MFGRVVVWLIHGYRVLIKTHQIAIDAFTFQSWMQPITFLDFSLELSMSLSRSGSWFFMHLLIKLLGALVGAWGLVFFSSKSPTTSDLCSKANLILFKRAYHLFLSSAWLTDQNLGDIFGINIGEPMNRLFSLCRPVGSSGSPGEKYQKCVLTDQQIYAIHCVFIQLLWGIWVIHTVWKL